MTAAPGLVVWITGLPSAGKSLFAQRLLRRLQDTGICACILDGDDVRAALRPSPGYSSDARDHFYASLAGLAALVAGQGQVVLVPATANRRAYRERARELAPRFLEVFVDVPVDTCRGRDEKGLYAAAEIGHVSDMPGADARYERPKRPDVIARGGQDDRASEEVQRRVVEIARAAQTVA